MALTFDVLHACSSYAWALGQVEAGEALQLANRHQAAAAQAITALQVKHLQPGQPSHMHKTCTQAARTTQSSYVLHA